MAMAGMMSNTLSGPLLVRCGFRSGSGVTALGAVGGSGSLWQGSQAAKLGNMIGKVAAKRQPLQVAIVGGGDKSLPDWQ